MKLNGDLIMDEQKEQNNIRNKKSLIECRGVDVFYGDKQALFGINLDIGEKEVTSLIGPSGCGKSTFLRCINRMNDLVEICNIKGQSLFDSEDITDENQDAPLLRMKISMVFQKPNPFPKSIYDNVAFGPKLHGMVKSKGELDNIVVQSLSKSGLYDEVKDRLFEPGTSLSGGQQQRLCIARALAVNPEILLMDEPCSALDPIATAKIEDLIAELKQQYTIVIVTHSMQQAARVSDRTAYMHMGELIETGMTKSIFSNPQHKYTKTLLAAIPQPNPLGREERIKKRKELDL